MPQSQCAEFSPGVENSLYEGPVPKTFKIEVSSFDAIFDGDSPLVQVVDNDGKPYFS